MAWPVINPVQLAHSGLGLASGIAFTGLACLPGLPGQSVCQLTTTAQSTIHCRQAFFSQVQVWLTIASPGPWVHRSQYCYSPTTTGSGSQVTGLAWPSFLPSSYHHWLFTHHYWHWHEGIRSHRSFTPYLHSPVATIIGTHWLSTFSPSMAHNGVDHHCSLVRLAHCKWSSSHCL